MITRLSSAMGAAGNHQEEFFMNKKRVLLVMLACLLAGGLAFVACDNGSGGGGGGGGGSPVGTWELEMTRREIAQEMAADPEMEMTVAQAEAMLEMMGVPSKVVVAKLVFTETTCTMYDVDIKDGTETEEGSAPYTQSGNTLSMTIDGETMTGTISGNSFNTQDPETGKNVTFKKK
jgi:hypothetical protein